MLARRRRRPSRAGHGRGRSVFFGDDGWSGYIASPWNGQPVHDRFRFQRGQPWHLGNQTGEQGAHDRSRKATSSYFFGSVIVPGQGDIHATRRKFDEMPGFVEEGVVFIGAGHVRCYNTGKVTGPFRRGEVVVVASRDYVDAFEI